MITKYFRPQSIEEALNRLSKANTLPLGGGTVLTQLDEAFSVVDLQSLGLDTIRKIGNNLEIGASTSLQKLLESPHSPEELVRVLKQETPLNIRNMSTVAGTLVTCTGRSPFSVVMLALDTQITIAEIQNTTHPSIFYLNISFGNLLPFRSKYLHRKLITSTKIPLNVRIAFETVARSPADKPIVCAALVHWNSGRTRLVLGGWGDSPTLGLDGNDPNGLEPAAYNAAFNASDEWASAEYRREIATILVKRCREKLSL
jgi:CO/xanthine dehydrogenase FAD-binding subunit